MKLSSTAFQHNKHIPAKYTCDGKGVNPPLTFADIPPEAKSLALIVDDPDAPSGLFTHWALFDMSPATQQIAENVVSGTGTQGRNDFQQVGYGGPCPPNGTHRYFFRLHALSAMLALPEGASRQQLNDAMNGKILDTAELVGLYEKGGEPSETFARDLSEYSDDRGTSEGQLIT